ncbi:enoyl-CoA hydratase/isomerase family protein [Aspergillus niger CBS 101883]|uniref:ClpP/crotonase n=1 Tax=Aspergillus niger ATCC 13496 TaxID=1353008 RepID=A0A370BI28_ASPNG|nr:ClpP/crotonase [Aspergillus niger CBS 101883]PYH62404.1 ClpP/crotonase [Aspergillus niger CBS 101883]RDH15127.1 ClpP/crotonase [Aspergillus niger ATCC 13496]
MRPHLQFSVYRREAWPSRPAATESLKRKPFYQAWDRRVFAQFVKYGLRDVLAKSEISDENGRPNETTPVRLTTPLVQELASFARPYHNLPAPDVGVGDPRNRLTHPDLDPEALTSLPFYRPEITELFPRLPYLRPSVLYIFGSESHMSLPELRSDKLRTTGIATGGSGGAAAGRVREVVMQGFSHQVPFEAVDECAEEISRWLACESRRWHREEQALHDRWGTLHVSDQMTIDKDWKAHIRRGHRVKSNLPIIVRLQGHIAVVTLNRPDKLNALDQDNYYQLGKIFRHLEKTPDVTITVLTGTGRYFSAGTDVGSAFRNGPYGTDMRRNMSGTLFNNLDLTHTLANFPKILIVALNGPVVGFPAALIAQADFIYAAPHTFLLTPFSSLGVAAEGAASRSFVQRLGMSKANEALIMSKRISCEELVACGFVNGVVTSPSGKPDDSVGFLKQVLDEVHRRFDSLAARSCVVGIKDLIRKPERMINVQQNCLEVFAGLDMVATGVPEQHVQALVEGQKKHKL